MKILYVASKFDYGHADRGWSFEHVNFHDALVRSGHDLDYFDFETLFKELGREGLSRRLRARVEEFRPDLMFCCLTGDQFDFNTVKSITDQGLTTTFNWFCDDHFRFEKFTRRWAFAFHWVSTTAACALPWYEAIGYKNALKTQWAANPGHYRRLDLPLVHDVSFVGRVYRERPALVQRLRDAGLRVLVRGTGWPEGRATPDEMVAIFNQSRVNLNFSDPPKHVNRFKRLLGRRQPPKQIKGRNFEIPGCGGFLLTDRAENLEEYFLPGQEIGVFEGAHDLVDQIRHYLSNDAERSAVAQAGYERTLREHTYEHRFNELFRRMELDPDASGKA